MTIQIDEINNILYMLNVNDNIFYDLLLRNNVNYQYLLNNRFLIIKFNFKN